MKNECQGLFDTVRERRYNFMNRQSMGKTYKLSFVAGGLLFPATVAVAKRYQQIGNWNVLREEITAGTLLRTTRASSRIRYFQEIRRRFRVVHPFELDRIAEENEGSRLAAFALCCRYYDFCGAFMCDVVREKVAMNDGILGNSDFYSFFEQKTGEHPELEKLTETSRRKVQTVLYRMLAEAGILDPATKQLTRPSLPEPLIREYLRAGDYLSLVHLLVPEASLQ